MKTAQHLAGLVGKAKEEAQRLAKKAQDSLNKGLKSNSKTQEDLTPLTESEEQLVEEIKSQINKAYLADKSDIIGKYHVINELALNDARVTKKIALDKLKEYAAGLFKVDGDAILTGSEISAFKFKTSDIITAKIIKKSATFLGNEFLKKVEKLLAQHKDFSPYDSIPTTAASLEKIYKKAKEKLPNNEGLDNIYNIYKQKFTKLEQIDPEAILTNSTITDLGYDVNVFLKANRAKAFANFLSKEPFLGPDLSSNQASIGRKALEFAIENFRSTPQNSSSNPEMLYQVIELVKEQNRGNKEVLTQLAQELVNVSNNASWPLAILDLNSEIKKLEKLGAKITNYNFGSLSKADQENFVTIAQTICRADDDSEEQDKMAQVINISADKMPTEAEMISAHKALQAIQADTSKIPARPFIISSLKMITEEYIKAQINDHGNFQAAIKLMEAAQDSPTHRLAGDKEKGVNELRDFTIAQMEAQGEKILEDYPEDFNNNFLTRNPLFSSRLNKGFANRVIQFAISKIADEPEVSDKILTLFKEQYKDNDKVLEDLTNTLIEYSNLLGNDPKRQQALNKKINEYFGEFLNQEHIDINGIIREATEDQNISLVSTLILNNPSAEIDPNIRALKLMHNSDSPDAKNAAEKLLQRPEEVIGYLASSDIVDDNLFKLIISKVPNQLDSGNVLALLSSSNSSKKQNRKKEINQKIEENIDNFIKTSSNGDFIEFIQRCTYDNQNPQLLSSLILHNNDRQIIYNISEIIKSMQLLYREGYENAVDKLLENPDHALSFVKESMDRTTKEHNPTSDKLFETIVDKLITNPKFNPNIAYELIQSIDHADAAQKKILYEKMLEHSGTFLAITDDTQSLINKTIEDEEVNLLSEIIKRTALTDTEIDLDVLELLNSKGKTEAIEKLLQNSVRANKYLGKAINTDIEPKLFKQIIKSAAKEDPNINYEEADIEHPDHALINCSNKAKNLEQRKALNAEINLIIPTVEGNPQENEDLVNEATAAKNGELLSILIDKNIIRSAGVTLKTLEVLHEGKHTAARDKLLKDPELAAGLLFEAAQAKELNQDLVTLLIPQTIIDKSLGKPLLDALMPRITNAEELNKIIDSQTDPRLALEATAKDPSGVSVGLLSPKNTAALTRVMLEEGLKGPIFSETLRKLMEETYQSTKSDPRPLTVKIAEKIYPDNPSKLTDNDKYNKAVTDYEKKLTSFEKQPILTKMRAFFARSRSERAMEALEKTDVMAKMKGFFAKKDSIARYKTMKVNEKLNAIQRALTEIFSDSYKPEPQLSTKAKQAVEDLIVPTKLTMVDYSDRKSSASTSSITSDISELSTSEKARAAEAAHNIIEAERKPSSTLINSASKKTSRNNRNIIDH